MLKENDKMKLDMTVGSPTKNIFRFAVPVMLSNIFQQMYNTAAAIIAGRLIGKDALAAIGIADPVVSIAIFLMFGICVGVSVLLAQLYGADDYEGFKVQTSTALIAGCIFTILLSFLCMFISKPILVMAKTPEIVLNDADRYIKIVFCGLIFSFLYNFFSSALRAIGDSKTPFIFLLVSCCLNICMSVFFVKVFDWGVSSMAVSTVIAQATSALSCIIYVYKKIPILSLKRNEFIFKMDVLIKTVQYSCASAIQQTFLYIGRFLVQSSVNPLGAGVIAAYNSATRVEAFALAPFDSVATSLSTFVAQNMGAGLYDRIKQGYSKSQILCTAGSFVVSIILFVFSPKAMSIFVSDEGAAFIDSGSQYLKTIAIFYFLVSLTALIQGLFRGIGLLAVTMIATGFQFSIRVMFAHTLVPILGIRGVGYAAAIGWLCMVLFQVFHVRKLFKQISRYELTQQHSRSVS